MTAPVRLSRGLPDPGATDALGRALAPLLRPGDLVCLRGDLGAGKSALARSLIRARAGGAEIEVPSPTFTLVQDYDLPGGLHLWHVDLYRLASPDEAAELGLDDALRGGAVVLIEWPERIEGLLPADRLDVTLELPPAGGGGRVAHLTGGPGWADRLAGLAAGG
ncbi:MAG TPA: tRNA (adenosine(37)-N6)-threonylcarbamoyltransferase complex ATPase subunit type 1 TsaE [Geminicoccaceae bacterium]|nr:tRNA (adenosine(37)-N6)-threonylcarbamoyltransferase complex ATPase subunit type 1 TsaE [Geminicoccaceae bacterium]